MKIQGAVIKEQGVTFGIVVTKKHIVDSKTESEKAFRAFNGVFGNIPIVLMGQDSRGIPKYRGRRDIVNFLANVHISQIPWKEYTVS
ncbi:MAG: hypothetical protein JXK07_11590 [Spirochaetes bacterium]|nr:hypothetical protein [Spirochaetota bacterium]MBN2770823.1 hypothetical protein [Spirochaetota bacterium]